MSKSYILDTDGNNFGIGAVHSELNIARIEQPISFYSEYLSKPERRYSVSRKKLYFSIHCMSFYVIFFEKGLFFALIIALSNGTVNFNKQRDR